MEAIGGSRGLIPGLWAPVKAPGPSALCPAAPSGRGLGTGGAAPARRGALPAGAPLASRCVNYSPLLIIPWRQRSSQPGGSVWLQLGYLRSFYRAAVIAARVSACEWVNRARTPALADDSHLSAGPVQPLSPH